MEEWGVAWLFVEIVMNFFKVSYSKRFEKLEKIRDIAKHYAKGRFWMDLICLVGLLIDIIFDFKFSGLIRLTFLLKLSDCLEKIQILEIKILDTSYKENWWGLIKIFLSNFMFAHVLAVILIMISWLDA